MGMRDAACNLYLDADSAWGQSLLMDGFNFGENRMFNPNARVSLRVEKEWGVRLQTDHFETEKISMALLASFLFMFATMFLFPGGSRNSEVLPRVRRYVVCFVWFVIKPFMSRTIWSVLCLENFHLNCKPFLSRRLLRFYSLCDQQPSWLCQNF